ncbi:MAG: GxxExxY protein [Candidatus Omnitrophota bacterium]
MEENKITEKIIGLCFEVHKILGPGFPEKIYQNALEMLFEREGLKFQSEKQYDVIFKDEKIGLFKVDFLIEDAVIIEIKSITGRIPKVFEAQLISYLKASDKKAGLLVNFGDISCVIRRLNNTRSS